MCPPSALALPAPPFHRYTIENNLGATHNVLCGIVESGLDIHLVHLGTMGVCKHPPQHHPLTCPPLLRNKMGRAADRGARG